MALPIRRGGRCIWLFTALVAMIMVYPYFKDHELRGLVATSALLIFSIRVVSHDRFHFTVTSLAAVIAIGCSSLALQLDNRWLGGVGLITLAAFYTYILVIVLRFAVAGRVTTEKLLAALSGYMLAGFTWAALYRLVTLLEIGAFATHGSDPMDPVYFSFVTLCTIGYGDITAAAGPARSLAILEGIFGIFYVAVLVSRLVNLAGQLAEDDE